MPETNYVHETAEERAHRIQLEQTRKAVRDGILDAVHELLGEGAALCSAENLNKFAAALEGPKARSLMDRVSKVLSKHNSKRRAARSEVIDLDED
jgi:hypothetical protein